MNTITHDYSERKKGVKDRWMHNLSFHVFIRLLREDNQKKKKKSFVHTSKTNHYHFNRYH